MGSYLLRAAVLVTAGACGGAELQLDRQLNGETRTGPFVPPFAYEAFLRGELALARGELNTALEAYQDADAGGPEDALVMARLAATNQALGNTESANRWLDRGFGSFPNSEALWLARGRIAELRNDPEGARESFQQAVCIAPNSSTAALALASHHRTNDPGAAAAVLRGYAARTGGTMLTLTTELELALRSQPPGDPAYAAEVAVALANRDPRSLEVALSAVRMLKDNQRSDLAAVLVESLGDQQVPPTLRAQVFLAAGRPRDAQASLRAYGADSVPDEIQLWLSAGDAEAARILAEREWLVDPSIENTVLLARSEAASEDPSDHARAAARLSNIPAGTAASEEARALLANILEAAHLRGLGGLLRQQTHERWGGSTPAGPRSGPTAPIVGP